MTRDSLRNLSRISLMTTARMRSRHGQVTVYRGTSVKIDGSMNVSGSLRLGCQWSGSPFFFPGHLLVTRGGTLAVRGSFQIFTGLNIVIDPGGRLTLGSGYINSDVRIACFSSVSIGDDVAISERVTIRDSDNHEIIGRDSPTSAPIVIGDHVWIGLGSTILKGVTIGEGSVVAAGSMVVRDVPQASLVAGVPAKVRRTGISWR